METIKNWRDAKDLAYSFHKEKVEGEVKRIMEWIEARARIGCISTEVILPLNIEVCVFVMEDLQFVKGFIVNKSKIWNQDSSEWVYKLYICWTK